MAEKRPQRVSNQIVPAQNQKKTHQDLSLFVYWVIQRRRWAKVKIVVVKSPKALRGILKSIFKVK